MKTHRFIMNHLVLYALVAVVSTAVVVSATDDSFSLFSARFTSDAIEDVDLLTAHEDCDADPSCAGVSLDENRIHQHAWIGPFATPTTIRSKKEFVRHAGRATGTVLSTSWMPLTAAKSYCKEHVDCVAFTYATTAPGYEEHLNDVYASFLSSVDMISVDKNEEDEHEWTKDDSDPPSSDRYVTYIWNSETVTSIHPDAVVHADKQTEVDSDTSTCCGQQQPLLPSMEEIRAADSLPRISCNISRHEFLVRYEIPQIPVM